MGKSYTKSIAQRAWLIVVLFALIGTVSADDGDDGPEFSVYPNKLTPGQILSVNGKYMEPNTSVRVMVLDERSGLITDWYEKANETGTFHHLVAVPRDTNGNSIWGWDEHTIRLEYQNVSYDFYLTIEMTDEYQFGIIAAIANDIKLTSLEIEKSAEAERHTFYGIFATVAVFTNIILWHVAVRPIGPVSAFLGWASANMKQRKRVKRNPEFSAELKQSPKKKYGVKRKGWLISAETMREKAAQHKAIANNLETEADAIVKQIEKLDFQRKTAETEGDKETLDRLEKEVSVLKTKADAKVIVGDKSAEETVGQIEETGDEET